MIFLEALSKTTEEFESHTAQKMKFLINDFFSNGVLDLHCDPSLSS